MTYHPSVASNNVRGTSFSTATLHSTSLRPILGVSRRSSFPFKSVIDHAGCKTPERFKWKTSPSEYVIVPSDLQPIVSTAASIDEPESLTVTLGLRNPALLNVQLFPSARPVASDPCPLAHVRDAISAPSEYRRDSSFPVCF